MPQIDETIEIAESPGINSIPVIIPKYNSVISGYRDADALIKLIDNVK